MKFDGVFSVLVHERGERAGFFHCNDTFQAKRHHNAPEMTLFLCFLCAE